MIEIVPLDVENDTEKLLSVIQKSFLTVAKDFNLTQKNAPTNPAFLTIDQLRKSITDNLDFYIARKQTEIVGCVGIQRGKNDGEYYIERLAVLPEYRHNKLGKNLLNKAIFEIKKKKAKQISIGIINENIILKEWYRRNGFREHGTKKFDHLPFTVCFMGMELGGRNE